MSGIAEEYKKLKEKRIRYVSNLLIFPFGGVLGLLGSGNIDVTNPMQFVVLIVYSLSVVGAGIAYAVYTYKLRKLIPR